MARVCVWVGGCGGGDSLKQLEIADSAETSPVPPNAVTARRLQLVEALDPAHNGEVLVEHEEGQARRVGPEG